MTEPVLPRKCPRKEVHDKHQYTTILLRGNVNIGFGQKFECPGKVLSTRPLTENEKAILEVIAAGRFAWLSYVNMPEHSPQGAHQSAASLVRKGLVIRHKGRDGMFYDLTSTGRDILRKYVA